MWYKLVVEFGFVLYVQYTIYNDVMSILLYYYVRSIVHNIVQQYNMHDYNVTLWW